jgi:predicted dehydrogenase/threonine dehydrogenase-like Zn-dependent dehydrogenase
MSILSSRLRKAIVQPYKIPGYLQRRFKHHFGSVAATQIVWPEPGRALLVDFGMYRPTGRQTLVLTHATLISPGTERAFFNAQPNARPEYPYYPGYCGSGIVAEIGPQVSRFKPGDRVAAALPHASAMILDEDRLTPVPGAVTLDQAAFLRLGVIALQGVRMARIQLGERVAVIGQGLIGLLATQFAASSGAFPVIALAHSDARLPLAARLGAHHTLAVGGDVGGDSSRRLADIQADVTIDSTGNPDALRTAIACTRDGGRIVLLGSARGVTRGVDFGALRTRRLTIVGAHVDSLAKVDSAPGLWAAEREARTFFTLVADGRVQIDPLISHEVFPPEAELFYRRLSRSDRSILGALLRWDRLSQPERLDGHLRDRLRPDSSVWAIMAGGASTNGHRSSDNLSALRDFAVQLPPKSEEPASMEKPIVQLKAKALRVGLIGCGEIAVANARAIQESGNAAITCVADVNEAVAADLGRRNKAPYTTRVEELLRRDDVDAVLVSVPHHLHAPLTLQAAEHGKHVMVEKPMATNVADADRMIAACRQAGVRLSILYCQRYLPYVQRAKSLIERGALGGLLGVQLNFYMDKPPGYFTSGFSGRVNTDWRLSREKSGGGILIFNLVHYLDILRYLTGLEVTRVFGEFDNLDTQPAGQPVETEDSIAVTLRFANNAIGTITASSVVRGAPYQPHLRLWGTDGQMNLLEPDQHTFYSLRQIDGLRPGRWHPLKAGLGGDRREFVTRFARSVLNGETPEVSGEDGRVVQAIVEAIYASGERRTAVEVDRI